MAAKETLDDAEKQEAARGATVEAARAALSSGPRRLRGEAPGRRRRAGQARGRSSTTPTSRGSAAARSWSCRSSCRAATNIVESAWLLRGARATRPAVRRHVRGPLLQTRFYDGAKCRVAVAEKTRQKEN